MNDAPDGATPTTTPTVTPTTNSAKPHAAARYIALAYAALAAIAAVRAWMELVAPHELEFLIWLPASILLTGLFVAAAAGTVLLWRSSGHRAVSAAYFCCIVLGVLTGLLFVALPASAVVSVAVLAGPAILVLTLLNKRPAPRET